MLEKYSLSGNTPVLLKVLFHRNSLPGVQGGISKEENPRSSREAPKGDMSPQCPEPGGSHLLLELLCPTFSTLRLLFPAGSEPS